MDVSAFRQAMADAPSAIAIVTSRDAAGSAAGATLTAFLSLSLMPPLVLVSLGAQTRTASAISISRHFAVHVLAADQEALAQRFSMDAVDKFAGLHWTSGAGGAPLLEGCAAQLECRLATQHPGGDHEIFIGQVLSATRAEAADAAVWWRRRFRRLAEFLV